MSNTFAPRWHGTTANTQHLSFPDALGSCFKCDFESTESGSANGIFEQGLSSIVCPAQVIYLHYGRDHMHPHLCHLYEGLLK